MQGFNKLHLKGTAVASFLRKPYSRRSMSGVAARLVDRALPRAMKPAPCAWSASTCAMRVDYDRAS